MSVLISMAPSMAPSMKSSSLHLLGTLVVFGSSCASYDETRIAFDSMAGMDPSTLSEPREASYGEKALMHGWVTEAFSFGSDDVLSVYESVFGNERSSSDVDAPDQFVRESLTTLVDLSGQDLERLAESAYRVSYVLAKDPQPLSRAIATHLSGRLMQERQSAPVPPDAAGLAQARAQDYLAEARVLHKRLKPHWPGIRAAGAMSESARNEYLDTLTALVALPAATSQQERERLQLLLELTRTDLLETAIQDRLRELLAGCLDSLVLHGIADSLMDPDPHVRETAVFQFWRLGGKSLLPWVLDRLELNRTDTVGRVIDPSPEVRRRLLQCIWSLDLASAEQRYDKALSPLEYLQTTAIYDNERHLKFLATECLAHLLDRPNEVGSHWVKIWWEGYVHGPKKPIGTQD